MKKKNLIRLQDITFGTIAVSSLFLLVGASGANAATSAVDEVTITVPASCSLTNTIGSPHTATIETGVYQDDIGETTFKVFCNDNEGFSVYAVGYTNDEFGNTTMKPSTLAVSNAIATGTATSGNTSNWAMKLTAVSGDYAPTLETGFNDYHVIPDTYTKVASYSSNTDATIGSSFKSTYGAFISQTQPADSYTGKVKYTVVHPASELPQIESISQLTYMQDFMNLTSEQRASVVNSMSYNTTYNLIDNRDNKTYKVARLKDDNIWMAENLDLGRTTLTVDLSSINTNLDTNTTVSASTFNGWKKTSGSYSYTVGEFISIDGTDTTSGAAYGTLYNYYAASAGTITGNSNNNDATNDICPAGWRLPTGGSYGELHALNNLEDYDTNGKMRAQIVDGGAAFALAGYFSDRAPANQGSYGYYWSSTNVSSTNVYEMYLNTSSIGSSSYGAGRNEGNSIRCVLKEQKDLSKLIYLQDFKKLSTDEKALILASMDDNTTYSFKDIRDNKSYTVAKLKDGKIWMVDNLDLGRTNLNTNLNGSNTNLSDEITAATFNTWRKTSSSNTYTAGEFMNVSGTDATSGTIYGTLYNYYAASAGTISGSSSSKKATFDICPAGWRLPTGESSGELRALYGQYGSLESNRAPITSGGAAFALAGIFNNSSATNQGSFGGFWTSDGSYDARYYISLDAGGATSTLNTIDRRVGISIRCVANL